MNFRLWLETDNEAEWRRLFDHILKMGDWLKPEFHANIIRMLRNVGMDQEANDLEMVKPSQDDIDFGNTPYGGIGAMTIGAAMDWKSKRKKQASFEAASRAYHAELESIADKVEDKAHNMGWGWD